MNPSLIPEQLTKGRFADWSFAALLIAARRTQATGLLRVGTRVGDAEIFFRGGIPAGAASSRGYRPIAQVLLEEGLIAPDAFAAALADAAEGKHADEVLRKRAGDQAFAQAEATLAARTLATIAREARGEFEFTNQSEPPSWAGTAPAPFSRVLLDSLAVEGNEAVLTELLAGTDQPGQGIAFDDAEVAVVSPWLNPEERAKAVGVEAASEFISSGAEAKRLAGMLLLIGAARLVDFEAEKARQTHQASAKAARNRKGKAEAARAKRLEEAERRAADAKRRAPPSDFGDIDIAEAIPEPAPASVPPWDRETGRFKVPEPPPEVVPREWSAKTTDTGKFGREEIEQLRFEAERAAVAVEPHAAHSMEEAFEASSSPGLPQPEVVGAVEPEVADEQVGLWNLGVAGPGVVQPIPDPQGAPPPEWSAAEQVGPPPIMEATWESIEPIIPEPVEIGSTSPPPGQPYADADPAPASFAAPIVVGPVRDRSEPYVDQVIELTDAVPQVESGDPLGLFGEPRPVYLTPRPGVLEPAELPSNFIEPPRGAGFVPVREIQPERIIPTLVEPVAPTGPVPSSPPPSAFPEPIVPERVIEATWLEAPEGVGAEVVPIVPEPFVPIEVAEAAPVRGQPIVALSPPPAAEALPIVVLESEEERPAVGQPPAERRDAPRPVGDSPIDEARPYDPEFSAHRSERPREEARPYDPEFSSSADESSGSYLDSVSRLTDEVPEVGEGNSLGVFAPSESRAESPGQSRDRMSEDVKYRNDEERERRQRLLRKAIENLGVLRPPGAEGGAAEAGRPAAAEASNAQQFSANLTPSDQELAEKIETKSRLISHEDFFARLGVARTSSKEQIKSWFFQLAKTYHPDRLPPALAHLAPQASKVFEQLREAYDTLVDDARRIAYLSQLNRGAAAPPKTRRTAAQEEAKKELVLAEGAMRKKEFAEAEQHFARAQELEPNALHLASRAWAIYLDPSRKADIEKAKSLLAEALRTDASCDRALYYSGIISRVEGNGDLAERFFRSALSANPKNVEAQAELRLMEMRRQKPDKPKKGFFW